jgi:hypothetical protein
MTRQEKLVLLLLALVVLSRLAGFGRDLYLASAYGAPIPPDVKLYWENASLFIAGLVNVGAAVWLYVEAKAIALKAWVWSLFGLAFGLIGIILFYAIQIFSKRHAPEI